VLAKKAPTGFVLLEVSSHFYFWEFVKFLEQNGCLTLEVDSDVYDSDFLDVSVSSKTTSSIDSLPHMKMNR